MRVFSQVRVEQVIMAENSKHFVLACSSPLLCRDVLEKIELLGEEVTSQRLINEGVIIPEVSPVLSKFLQLLYQPDPKAINHHISTDQ